MGGCNKYTYGIGSSLSVNVRFKYKSHSIGVKEQRTPNDTCPIHLFGKRKKEKELQKTKQAQSKSNVYACILFHIAMWITICPYFGHRHSLSRSCALHLLFGLFQFMLLLLSLLCFNFQKAI